MKGRAIQFHKTRSKAKRRGLVYETSDPVTLIVEKNTSGHRLYYVRMLATAACERGTRVVIALCLAQAETSEVAVHLSDLPDGIDIIHVTDLSLKSVTMLSRDVNASVTVVPDGDLFAIDLGLRGKWSGLGLLSVLVMREVAQRASIPGMQAFKSKIRVFFFARASRIPNVRISILKTVSWRGGAKFPIAVDPVTMIAAPRDVAALRISWALDHDRYWFGILGAISERKNVAMVADALAMLPGDRVGFLVAGKCEVDAAMEMRKSIEQLQMLGAKVVLVDRLLTDLEIDSAVRSVDCVVLAHSNEGSSGLYGKAMASGTRIVAAGARSLKLDCAANSAGATWVDLDVAELSRVLEAATRQRRPSPVGGMGTDNFVSALL